MAQESRRDFFLKNLLLPLAAGSIGGIVTNLFAEQLEDRHSFAIALLPSEDALAPTSVPMFPIEGPPEPTPTPGPGSRYTYVVLITNDGDFSEENVVIAFGFHSDVSPNTPLFGPQIGWSSPLLSRSVAEVPAVAPPGGFGLTIERMNPSEWVSLQATWRVPPQISVQVRSHTVSASAYY